MAEIPFKQPLPIPDEDSTPYWEGCRKSRLMLQRCGTCGTVRFPPQHLCPSCWSENADWVQASGRGEVYTFGVVRRALRPDWRERVPYVVALVCLEEGPKLFTNIVDCRPEEVAIGMPVVVIFDQVSEEIVLPKFRPLT